MRQTTPHTTNGNPPDHAPNTNDQRRIDAGVLERAYHILLRHGIEEGRSALKDAIKEVREG